MAIHSGYLGAVNGLSTVRGWTLNDAMETKKYVASNTLAGTGRRKGNKSWGGSINFYGAIPPVMPSEIFAFAGFVAPTNGVAGANGTKLAGNAIVDSVVITWNWKSADPISHVVNFSGHLGLTPTTNTNVTDSTDPDVPGICGTKIQTSTDGASWTDLDNVSQAVLTISAANQAYMNSSTACLTGRLPGPIDWALAIQRDEDAFFGTKGDDYYLKLFTDASDFWQLKWGMLKDYTNLTVDPESNAIITHSMLFEMNGNVSGVTGFINQPSAITWWPF